MGVKIKRDKNNVGRFTTQTRELNGKTIKVGIFGSSDRELVKIAKANEFGVTIRPKSGKFLAIPAKKARGRSPRDYSNLVFISANKSRGGVLAMNPKKGQPLDIYFYLVSSMTIPERSFIRAGIDNNIADINRKFKRLIDQVLQRNIKVDVFMEALGLELAGYVQKEARNLTSPPNAPATIKAKGSSNPLIDTGRMVGAIRHEIE